MRCPRCGHVSMSLELLGWCPQCSGGTPHPDPELTDPDLFTPMEDDHV